MFHVPRELQGTVSEAAQGPFLTKGTNASGLWEAKLEASAQVPILVWSEVGPHGSQAPQDHPLAFTQKACAQPSPQGCHPGDHLAAKAPN